MRDSAVGKLALLGLVLVAALVSTRTCGSANENVTREEAVEIALDSASFEPCAEQLCVQVRYVPRGIPVRGYWGVVLAPDLDAQGEPVSTESFLIDVTNGAVSRP